MLDGVIAGATGIGDSGGLWTVTVEVIKFSAEELSFSELLDVCTVYPVAFNFEFVSKTGELVEQTVKESF